MTGRSVAVDASSAAGTHDDATLYSYRCEACGGSARWQPAKQLVTCSSCSTPVPLPAADTTRATSFLLVPYLRDTPENRRKIVPARVDWPCPTCSHVVVFEAAIEGTTCEACLTPLLRPPHGSDMPIRPTGIVPLRIDETDARDRLRAWWHRHRRLNPRLRHLEPGPLVRRYVPYWQFSVRVHCPWRFTRQDERGAKIVREGEVTGDYGEYEPGNHNLPADLLRTFPFPFEHAVAYDRRYLAGAIVEQYDADIFHGWDAARWRIDRYVNDAVDKASGVFSTPQERWPSWSNEKGWLILTPYYTATVDVDGARHHIVIDGHSGQVASTVPVRWTFADWVIMAVILAALGGLVWGAVALVQWALSFFTT